MLRVGTFSNSDVDSTEDLIELEVRDATQLWVAFVVGTADLTGFEVGFRLRVSGNVLVVASAAGDYTQPLEGGPVLGAGPSSLTTAAAGSTVHWLKLDVAGVHSVRLRAAGTSSTISGEYRLY